MAIREAARPALEPIADKLGEVVWGLGGDRKRALAMAALILEHLDACGFAVMKRVGPLPWDRHEWKP